MARLRALAVWMLLALAVLGLLCACGWIGQDWAVLRHAPLRLPQADLWFGSNGLGQDLGARWLQALAGLWHTALPAAALSLACATAVAWCAAGSGLLRGPARLLIDLADVLPPLLLLLALGFVLRGHSFGAVLALTGCLWPESVRLLEVRLRQLRGSDWYLQAEASGASHLRLVWVQLARPLEPVLRVQALLLFVLAVKTELLLSFLGMNSSASVTLGGLLAEGLNATAQGAWWPLLLPCCTLLLIVAGALALGAHSPDMDSRLQ